MVPVTAKKIQFLRLPDFAWEAILKGMGDWELMMFSTLSKKTKIRVRIICAKREEVDVCLTMRDEEPFGLSAELTVGTLRFLFFHETGCPRQFVPSLSSSFEIPGPGTTLCVVEEDHLAFYGDAVKGLAYILGAACVVFPAKWFSLSMTTNSEITERMLTVLQYTDLEPSELSFIPVGEPSLELCKKVFQIGLRFSYNLKMYGTTPLTCFPKGIAFENLDLFAPWIEFSHLCQLLNSKKVEIKGAYFSDENIIEFIKAWSRPSNLRKKVEFTQR